MHEEVLRRAEKLKQTRKSKQNWKKAVSALACVVVFCTTYALILPAITMEAVHELVCTEQSASGHTHTGDCYDANGNTVCGYADFVLHTHTEDCYAEDGTLVCSLREIVPHRHTADCYETTEAPEQPEEPMQPEIPEQPEEPMQPEIPEQPEKPMQPEIPADPGHTHDESCYAQGKTLVCELPEAAGHVHAEACMGEDGEIICESEESQGHTHTDACYAPSAPKLICGEDEREPSEAAYAAEEARHIDAEADTPAVVQTDEEPEPVLVCTKQEITAHRHTDDCFSEDGDPACGLTQVLRHVHTDTCFDTGEIKPEPAEGEETPAEGNGDALAPENPEEAEPTRSMVHVGSDYTVTVSFTEDAQLPEDVALHVREIAEGSEEYDEHYDMTMELLGEEGILFCRFFDVSFMDGEQEMEPAASVDVQISYADPILQSEDVECTVVHFADTGMEEVPVELQLNEQGEDTFSFTQDSFSVVGIAIKTLELHDGSYIFYKDSMALGVLRNGTLNPYKIQLDEEGNVSVEYDDVKDYITWEYRAGGLYNKGGQVYLSLGENGADTAYSPGAATAVEARIINNAVRFSRTVSSYYGSKTYYLGFDGTEYTASALFAGGDYFLAAKVGEPDTPGVQGDLRIEDAIKETGRLCTDGVATEGTPTYIWYRSESGKDGTWEEVPYVRVTGEEYNRDENGQWLNVALDGGTDMYYKVKLTEVNGQPLDESSMLESVPYHVPYYDQLQNGDFENPVISTDVSDAEHYQPLLPNGTAGMVWKTTASDGEVEFISVASDAFQKMSTLWHNCESAASGNQYVELNAGAAGALYQDVLTAPGSTMYWSLAHRGRGTTDMRGGDDRARDTMYVVVMSTKLAEEYDVTTQAAVKAVLRNPGNYPGAAVTEITDDNWQWYTHTGEYTVPDGQYLTRYYFVAGDTAFDQYSPGSGLANTIGNHLDNVYFSTELPPPAAGTANLTVKKTIRGMTEDDARSLLEQLVFSVKNESVSGMKFQNFTKISDTEFSATYQKRFDIPANGNVSMDVAEDVTSVRAMDYTYKGTSVSIDGGEPYEDENRVSVTLRDSREATVEFTNAYEPEAIPVQVQKVDGSGTLLAGAAFELVEDVNGEPMVSMPLTESETSGKFDLSVTYDKAYLLTETTAPAGYYPLTQPVYFMIVRETVDGEVTRRLAPCNQYAEEQSAWPDGVSVKTEQQNDGRTLLVLQIENHKGMELPETGADGAERLYAAGLAAIVTTFIFSGYTCLTVRCNARRSGRRTDEKYRRTSKK